jgi:hypothetical protein
MGLQSYQPELVSWERLPFFLGTGLLVAEYDSGMMLIKRAVETLAISNFFKGPHVMFNSTNKKLPFSMEISKILVIS